MIISTIHIIPILIFACLSTEFCHSFDEHDIEDTLDSETVKHEGPLPKDKVLLRDIKSLTFHRNKRTTSRRTHSIHQLSCVGGTAGCKLFTPDVVECENSGYDKGKRRVDWRCRAEISDRVKFNHVEVICEGYDYPEDDYILLGSCGLEFTLDYTDPQDYHHQSYFKHMDDHEKELHKKRTKPNSAQRTNGLEKMVKNVTDNVFLIGLFLIFVLISTVLVRFFSRGDKTKKPIKISGYGPLTSAVLTTKKAC